jgi:protein TonB
LIALLLLSQVIARPHPAARVSQWDVSLLEAPPPEHPVAAPPRQPSPVSRPVRKEVVKPVEQARVTAPLIQPPAPQPEPPRTTAPEPAIAPPPPRPEPPPPPVEAKPELPLADGAWLGKSLWDRMNAHKHYPLMARRMGVEGRVVIEAVIDARGQIVSASIAKSSGSEILDDDAMALLKAATPLKLEHVRLAERTTVRIPMVYSLD